MTAQQSGPVEALVAVPPEVRAYADELAPGVWPTADVAGLRAEAESCRDLARQSADLIAEVDHAHHNAPVGAGAFADAIERSHTSLTGPSALGGGELGQLSGRLEAAAGALDAYADAATRAHNEMAVIAAIADRDRLRADLLASLGDDSARVTAAGAGRLALTAAGEEYTDEAGRATRDHDGNPSTAATSGMMPFAALGALAGAGVVAGTIGHAPVTDARSELSEADIDWLQRRAAQLQAALPASVGPWVRMAVGLGVASDGTRSVVVGTSDPYPYERQGISLSNYESMAGNGRPPELAITDHLTTLGLETQAVAVATPTTSEVTHALAELGAELFAPTEVYGTDGAWTDIPMDGNS